MAEITHRDASLHDDGFHEIQLSGKQLVALFMGGTTIAVLIFLCGVQVGRNVKGDRVVGGDAADPTAVSAAADTGAPAPASTTSAAAPAATAVSSGPPAAEPPAPPADDELSYAKRLQGNNAGADEKLSTKPVEARSEAAPRAVPEQQGTKIADAKPATPKPEPAVALKAAPAAAAPRSEPTSTGRAGAWIVQLTALQDRAAAAAIASQLTAKGYPAFVVAPAPGAPAIYRVQVGGYPDRGQADQAARRLEKDEHYKPYVRSR